MSRMARLKVYRTPIGFHDAYVAATSQKAALRAWGTDRNLFARGVAEEVSDPALMEDALVAPGTVIRRPRGSTEEQIAAAHPAEQSAKAPRARAPRRAKPPDRQAVDEADAAIVEADRQFDRIVRQFEDEAARLNRRRAAAERAHERDRRRLEDVKARAERDYCAAEAQWREGEP